MNHLVLSWIFFSVGVLLFTFLVIQKKYKNSRKRNKLAIYIVPAVLSILFYFYNVHAIMFPSSRPPDKLMRKSINNSSKENLIPIITTDIPDIQDRMQSLKNKNEEDRQKYLERFRQLKSN